MFELKPYLTQEKENIDAALIEYLQAFCPSGRLWEPLYYAITAGGKRLRPILCRAAARAVGGRARSVMAAACALEMIHTYSLIHDDLPALDDDDLRRGRPTCHVRYGEATAILSGDALLNMAFEVLGETGMQASDHPTSLWMQVIKIIGHASGCRGMIEGQALDLANEGIMLDQAQLQALHELKTGAMIRAAVHCGGLLGGGSPDQIEELVHYADRIGLAFQVVDDVLNVTGDPEILGKAIGTDAQRRKNTYPALLGLEASQQYAAGLVKDALQALSGFDRKAEPLRAIAGYIIERNH